MAHTLKGSSQNTETWQTILSELGKQVESTQIQNAATKTSWYTKMHPLLKLTPEKLDKLATIKQTQIVAMHLEEHEHQIQAERFG